MPKFQTPQVTVGDPIFWYPKARLDKRYAHAGFVSQVQGDVLEIVVFSRGRYQTHDNVRHINDPILKDHKASQANGGWDFSDFHKRVMNLEAALKDLTSSRSTKGK